MPYLDPDRRRALDEGRASPQTAADLDYVLLSIVDRYLEDNGVSAERAIQVIGALESTKLEFYRRFAPYEDRKMNENGDVLSRPILNRIVGHGRE